MMSSDDLVNWLFAYTLIGAVILALLFSVGAMTKAIEESRIGAALASVGVVFGWPVMVAVFVAGMVQGHRERQRRAR